MNVDGGRAGFWDCGLGWLMGGYAVRPDKHSLLGPISWEDPGQFEVKRVNLRILVFFAWSSFSSWPDSAFKRLSLSKPRFPCYLPYRPKA